MKNILLLPIMAVALSGCVFTGSDYDSHVRGRVEFKQSDDSRIASQAASIADMAAKDSGSAEAAAYKNALAMLSISMLRNQDYGEAPPMTWTQVVRKVVDTIPFVAGMGGAYLIAKEGIRAAGNVTIGEGSTVSGSLNKPTATSVGESTTATVQPYDVRPEVVNPVIVPGGVQ